MNEETTATTTETQQGSAPSIEAIFDEAAGIGTDTTEKATSTPDEEADVDDGQQTKPETEAPADDEDESPDDTPDETDETDEVENTDEDVNVAELLKGLTDEDEPGEEDITPEMQAEIDRVMAIDPKLDEFPEVKAQLLEQQKGVQKLVRQMRDGVQAAKAYNDVAATFSHKETAPQALAVAVKEVSKQHGMTVDDLLDKAGLTSSHLFEGIDEDSLDLSEYGDREEFAKRMRSKVRAEIFQELKPQLDEISVQRDKEQTELRELRFNDKIRQVIPTIQRQFKAKYAGFVPTSEAIRKAANNNPKEFGRNYLQLVAGELVDEIAAHVAGTAAKRSPRATDLKRSNGKGGKMMPGMKGNAVTYDEVWGLRDD